MKKILITIVAGSIVAGSYASIANAIAAPVECTGVYTNTITASLNAKKVVGTNGNDLIYVNSNQNSVDAKNGDDCIVVTGNANLVKGGIGKDVIIDTGSRNYLQGEAGADYIIGGVSSYVDGGSQTDTCSVDTNTSLKRNCEL